MNATCPTCGMSQTVDRDEDGFADVSAQRCEAPTCEVWLCFGDCEHLSFECDGCAGRFCLEHKVALDDLAFCPNCAVAAVESQEPECECVQTDVDLFDSRSCPLHDSRSDWNRRLRAVTAIEQYEEAKVS